MYISTKSHGEKVFHTQFCHYAMRIKRNNRIIMSTAEEFRDIGYRACNCCSFIGKKYRKERQEIERYARENHMKIWFEDDVIFIETNIAAWKIVRYLKTNNMCLFHANTENYRYCSTKNGRIIHTYHLQKDARYNTILDFLKYIRGHDDWRYSNMRAYKKVAAKTKKQRANKKKASIRGNKKAVLHVLNMLDALKAEREYKEQYC